MTKKVVRCSFCNRTQKEVNKMIAGPAGVYICDECIKICEHILMSSEDEAEDENYTINDSEINLPTPKEINIGARAPPVNTVKATAPAKARTPIAILTILSTPSNHVKGFHHACPVGSTFITGLLAQYAYKFKPFIVSGSAYSKESCEINLPTTGS